MKDSVGAIMKPFNLAVLILLTATLVGCASMKESIGPTGLAQVENPVEAHRVELPENAGDLTLIPLRITDPRWFKTQLGYPVGEDKERQIIIRDAWKVILVTEGGVTTTSAIMNSKCESMMIMIQQKAEAFQNTHAHVYVVSGGGLDDQSKSLLTIDGKIIGPLAGQPNIDLEKLQHDASYRSAFMLAHPSMPASKQVLDARNGTVIREGFMNQMAKRFPGVLKDGSARVSSQALVAAGETNQATTMDKITSNVHVTATTGSFNPIGGGLAVAGLIYQAIQAADMPLHGSFEGSAPYNLNYVQMKKDCVAHVASQLSAR